MTFLSSSHLYHTVAQFKILTSLAIILRHGSHLRRMVAFMKHFCQCFVVTYMYTEFAYSNSWMWCLFERSWTWSLFLVDCCFVTTRLRGCCDWSKQLSSFWSHLHDARCVFAVYYCSVRINRECCCCVPPAHTTTWIMFRFVRARRGVAPLCARTVV